MTFSNALEYAHYRDQKAAYGLMNIEDKGDTLKISDIGELAASNAAQVREDARGALKEGHKNLDIDLSTTRFLDSSGLGTLIALHKTMIAQAGQVRLLDPTPMVTQVLELTRMHRIF